MKVIAFDLDDCICTRPKNQEHLKQDKYKHCEPIPEMVNIVNKFYDEGYYIKIYTARGMSIFEGDVNEVYKQLFNLTLKDLKKWGVKFNKLIMGKEHYDVLVDDKVNNSLTSSYNEIDNFLKGSEKIIENYIETWNENDAEKLRELFTDDIVLVDDIEYKGMENVIKANENIFNSLNKIVVSEYDIINKGDFYCDLTIDIENNSTVETIKVIDVISLEGDKISKIKAYKL